MCLKTLKIPVNSFCLFRLPPFYISIAAKVAYFAPWFPFWELCPQNSFFMACIIDGSFFYARRNCRNSLFYVSDMSEMLFLCVSFVSKCFLLCSVCSDSLFYGSVNSVFSLFVHCSQLAPALWVLFVCCLCVVSSEQVPFLRWENDRRKFTCFYSSECCFFLLLDFCPSLVGLLSLLSLLSLYHHQT